MKMNVKIGPLKANVERRKLSVTLFRNQLFVVMRTSLSIILSLIILSSCVTNQNDLPIAILSVGEFSIGDSFDECYEQAILSGNSFNVGRRDTDSLSIAWFSTRVNVSQTKSVLLRNIEALGTDVVHQIRFSIDNKNYSDDYADILNWLKSQYGDIKPQKIRWKEKRGEYQVVHKHLDYHYCWRFSGGYILAIERTHWMVPFSDQVVHEGLSVQFGLNE